METESKEFGRYRWVMLSMAWLLIFAAQSLIFGVSPIMNFIMEDAHLTHWQAGLIISATPLMFIVFCIPGGLIADRLGVKKAVGLAALVMGVFGLLRGFVTNFALLFGFTCLMGAGDAIVTLSLPKIVAAWFRSKDVGTATGLYLTGGGVGTAVVLALAVSVILPWTGSWQGVLQTYGMISLIIAGVWWAVVKSTPTPTHRSDGWKADAVPLMEGFQKVMKNRNVWFIGGIYFTISLAFYGPLGWLPYILALKGMPLATSSLVAALINFAFPATLIFPILSDRVRLRKPFVWGLLLILSPVTYYLGTAIEPHIWVVAAVFGICQYGIWAMLYILPVELVDRRLIGSALGLILSVGYVGGLISPWLMGYLKDITGFFDIGLILFAIVVAVSTLMGLFIPETGRRSSRHTVVNA